MEHALFFLIHLSLQIIHDCGLQKILTTPKIQMWWVYMRTWEYYPPKTGTSAYYKYEYGNMGVLNYENIRLFLTT